MEPFSIKLENGIFVSLCLLLICNSVITIPTNTNNEISENDVKNEDEAKKYLEDLESNYSTKCNEQMVARWNYITNVTDETSQKSVEALNDFLEYQASVQAEISEKFSDWPTYTDVTIKRQLNYLNTRGPANMSGVDIGEMNKIMNEMETSYATATVCEYKNNEKCDLKLADIEDKLTVSTDYDELAHYWTSWHDVIGKEVTSEKYKKFIDYQNQMAVANGFNDMSEMWLSPYNDGLPHPGGFYSYFKNYMKELWSNIQPQYNKLQAYVRMKLRQDSNYENKIKKFGYLPINLVGNVWAQDWSKLDGTTRPYLNISSLDATEAMIKQNYTVDKMFRVSDDFFVGLGLTKMSDTFWEKSDLVAPIPPVDKICHASAEDFCNGEGSEDFRVNMCTTITMNDLVTVHHEMGHIEYFMQYTHLPYIFREGANPGFHEAIGDALALAVTTPKHLQCELELDLGLEDELDCSSKSTQTPGTSYDESRPYQEELRDINFLYLMALQKFPLFPFAISMDSWRWEVFENKITKENFNKRWWEIRQQNQGIKPPTYRPNDSFDPAAKYHIVANVPYIRYFISHILQFEFYQAMCIEAGEFDPNNPENKPLHQCDFSGSKEAGSKLKKMMELGFSKPWPEALKEITGSSAMSTSALIMYFKPLFDFIDEQLNENNEKVCYGATCNMMAQEYLNTKYEPEVLMAWNKATLAEFDYVTDLNNEAKENASLIANTELANYQFDEWNENIRHYEYDYVLEEGGAEGDKKIKSDEILTQRQLKFLNAVGTAALPEKELGEYNNVLLQMSKAYGTAKICPFDKQNCDINEEGLTLEPHIEQIIASSKNYSELSYVWKAWRDASGKQIRENYDTYVDLSNQAAILNGYNDMSEFWILRYESDTFKDDMEKLWLTVKPLYIELHAYVRYRLKQKYPEYVKDGEPIPAHILGNMWAQTWDNIYPDVVPYPDAPIFDVTEKLKEKYNETEEDVRKLFIIADEFFTSIGLEPMDMSYGDKAMIVKPEDGRDVVCHASAWDFYDKIDFRIKMCTNVDMEDFITIHHELGHIEYFLNYKDLPSSLRDGANPGFHEAIGDVIALSVATPKHMVKIGLMDDAATTPESTINYLMKMALQKVAFLPFGFLIDSYRWKVFDGTIPKDKLEYNWLKMRSEFQGIVPPVIRSEKDFDAGAKYHVPGNTPYIRYFVSFILQFQLHKALCIAANEYDESDINKPLHNCDIYQNSMAGNILKTILESGLSQNWRELLQDTIGHDNLDSSPIAEYFKPLMTFLENEREDKKYASEWRTDAFEDFFDNGDNTIPTTTDESTISTIQPIGSSTTPSSDDDSTISTIRSIGSSPTPPSSDDDTPIAAIVVGIIIGVAVLVIIIGYLLGKKFKK